MIPLTGIQERILRELTSVSPATQGEVMDFLLFVKSRGTLPAAREQETPLPAHRLNAKALTKDWLTPEEDAAWLDL